MSAELSRSYPYLQISRLTGLPYEVVLLYADHVMGRRGYWPVWASRQVAAMDDQTIDTLEDLVSQAIQLFRRAQKEGI